MIFLKENINKIILIIIIVLLIVLLYLHLTKEKEYIKVFEETKFIKLYTNKNPNNIFKQIEKINENDKIKKILKENDIDKFIISNNGEITAGKHYSDEKYLVSITKDEEIKDIVKLEDESMYIYETEDTLIVTINKTIKEAKDDVSSYLNSDTLDEKKAVYVISKYKKMTNKFKKHIK